MMFCFSALTLLSTAFTSVTAAAVVARPLSLINPAIRNATLSPSSVLRNVTTTDNPHPNELFHYHIPQTSLTLWVRDWGSPLPIDDINACLHSLGLFIFRQIVRQGADRAARPAAYRHGNVNLAFDPLPGMMSWSTAGEVADALEAIVANDRWTFASHVAVVDERVGGTVGYLQVVYEAPGRVVDE
ncbi:MAG: hypothetical protein LQ346_001748 [Caloplaca aetnensis]|nr:MAG: hypothetical protein LQ346_001748 [Caloplaca aetnensis]